MGTDYFSGMGTDYKFIFWHEHELFPGLGIDYYFSGMGTEYFLVWARIINFADIGIDQFSGMCTDY